MTASAPSFPQINSKHPLASLVTESKLSVKGHLDCAVIPLMAACHSAEVAGQAELAEPLTSLMDAFRAVLDIVDKNEKGEA